MNNETMQKPARFKSHTITIDNRDRISVTGGHDVESFNDNEVVLSTDHGDLIITGSSLHITRLNLDDGQLILGGVVEAVEYDPVVQQKKLFSRVFR